MEAAGAGGGTGHTRDTGGGKAESGRGSSSWLLNTETRDREDGAPSSGISQPESPPTLAAPEHSLWPRATEVSACQDTWGRRKTRHQKQNRTPTPTPRGGEEQRELWTEVTRTGRHPGGEETHSVLRGSCAHPETPTHWPLVSFFFFFLSFFFLIPKPSIFKA